MSSIVELLGVPLIDHRVPSLLVHNISLSHFFFVFWVVYIFYVRHFLLVIY